MFAAVILLGVLGATTPAVPAESVRWAQVRVGISREQVSTLLGEPLMRNAARGYERWVYDAGCEVQFTRGEVTAWTAPKGAKPASAPVSQRDATTALPPSPRTS
ncbi:MAG TPA: outer membrane protein assembly factor BamE [Acidobacteriota bacterium]|nr:outer membrane protein assembly factor BamE [Acidobacteriota bacterium]